MKLSTPTKVELAMAISDLVLAVNTAAGAAHHFARCDPADTSMRSNTGQWRRCRQFGCTAIQNGIDAFTNHDRGFAGGGQRWTR